MGVRLINKFIVLLPFLILSLMLFAFPFPIKAAATQAPLTDAQIAEALRVADQVRFDFAKRAMAKAQHKDVKEFADWTLMEQVEEPSVEDANLKSRASQLSAKIKREEKRMASRLDKSKKDDFDKLYIDQQLKFHENLLKEIDETWMPAAQSEDLKKTLFQTRQQVKTYVGDALDAQIGLRKQ